MSSDRDFLERVARGVAVMVHYQNGPKTAKAKALMTAEVRAIADWAEGSAPGAEGGHGSLPELVRRELVARYGEKDAAVLHDAFLESYEGRRRPRLLQA